MRKRQVTWNQPKMHIQCNTRNARTAPVTTTTHIDPFQQCTGWVFGWERKVAACAAKGSTPCTRGFTHDAKGLVRISRQRQMKRVKSTQNRWYKLMVHFLQSLFHGRYLHPEANVLGVRENVQVTNSRDGCLVLENGLCGLEMGLVAVLTLTVCVTGPRKLTCLTDSSVTAS